MSTRRCASTLGATARTSSGATNGRPPSSAHALAACTSPSVARGDRAERDARVRARERGEADGVVEQVVLDVDARRDRLELLRRRARSSTGRAAGGSMP